MGGDVNEVLNLEEINSGITQTRFAMDGFIDVLNSCYLQDFGFARSHSHGVRN